MANGSYKQLCFNELSLQPLCPNETEAYRRVSLFARTLQVAQKSFGSKVVRYETDLSNIYLLEGVNLREFCTKHKHDAPLIAILSSHTMPQVDPEDEEKTETFEATSASIEKDSQILESKGFAAAYIHNTHAIGFNSETFWDNPIHKILINSRGNESAIDWPCFSTPEHVECAQTQQWVREHGELQLCESTLTFENKIVSLRDDHGKDILEEHATTLCHNKYVEGVLCSLPFKPKHRSYIYRIYDDGAIDIVLYWDDRGLSMRIKTTGRNIQETTAIAYILREQYGR